MTHLTRDGVKGLQAWKLGRVKVKYDMGKGHVKSPKYLKIKGGYVKF